VQYYFAQKYYRVKPAPVPAVFFWKVQQISIRGGNGLMVVVSYSGPQIIAESKTF
jgi:hypothetical protein